MSDYEHDNNEREEHEHDEQPANDGTLVDAILGLAEIVTIAGAGIFGSIIAAKLDLSNTQIAYCVSGILMILVAITSIRLHRKRLTEGSNSRVPNFLQFGSLFNRLIAAFPSSLMMGFLVAIACYSAIPDPDIPFDFETFGSRSWMYEICTYIIGAMFLFTLHSFKQSSKVVRWSSYGYAIGAATAVLLIHPTINRTGMTYGGWLVGMLFAYKFTNSATFRGIWYDINHLVEVLTRVRDDDDE